MDLLNVESLSKMIQLSLLPVVLISGVGLLLLSLTNRLARTIDRSRELAKDIRTKNPDSDPNSREQLQFIYNRCRFLQVSIALSSASVLFSSTMIVGFLLLFLFHWHIQRVIVGFFFLSVLCLIGSMIYFIRDILLALKALDLVIPPYIKN